MRARGGGPVADVGCGPGRVTTYLDGLGLDVSGVDLSPEMVAVGPPRVPRVLAGVPVGPPRDPRPGGMHGIYSTTWSAASVSSLLLV